MSSFFELYDLRVTVDEIRGRSVCGLNVGDYFEITESNQLRIPDNKHFCFYAVNSVIPFIAAKQRELTDNDWLAQDSQIVCPDPEEQLIMKIERIGKQILDSEELT